MLFFTCCLGGVDGVGRGDGRVADNGVGDTIVSVVDGGEDGGISGVYGAGCGRFRVVDGGIGGRIDSDIGGVSGGCGGVGM